MKYQIIIVLLGLIDRLSGFGLGVDWGSEYHKSTMLTAAGYRMVENHVSARKTPSMLSFCGEERFFENQAFGKFSRFACDTFYQLDRFIDSNKSTSANDTFYDAKKPLTDSIGTLFPTSSAFLKSFERNSTGLDADKVVTEPFVRFEEVLGMMLENERNNAQKTSQMDWKNAVFTIKDNSMSISDRKRLESAIYLAGLTPSAFVHENTAAMVYSSMDRPETETPQKEESVVVINVGSYSTKLSLVRVDYVANGNPAAKTTKFQPMVTTLKDVHSTVFSGHLLDVCLAEFALSKQIKSMKRTVSESELTLFKKRRLYNDIKKIKEMLSANKEVTFNVEDFFDDKPLNVRISRVEFEENCEPLFASFEALVLGFLLEVDRENILKVEIIGGSVRVPKVQEILREKFQLPLGQTINGDEGAAHGAAYIAANATTGLKMKKIFMQDGPNYKVDLTIDFPADPSRQEKSTELFPFKTNYGTKKKIRIAGLQTDAQVKLVASVPGDFEVVYNVSGVQKGLDKYADRNITEWKAVFFFQLDPLGIPKLASAELHLRQDTFENKTSSVNKTNATDNSTYKESVTETVPKVVNLTYKLTINVTSQSYLGLHERRTQFTESKELLKRIRGKEEERKRLSEMKNKLESFVYRLKAEATDADDRKFLNDTETEAFLAKSAEIDAFLFENDPANITKENIEILTLESEDLAQTLNFRKVESRERPRVTELWNKFLVNCTDAITSLKKERPWTPEERLNELRDSVDAAKEEVEGLLKKQAGMAMNVDPVIRTSDLSARVKTLTTRINKVGRIPKPKEAKNATEDLDGLLKDTMKKMKYNMTGDNLSDADIDELLKKYKDKKINDDIDDKEGKEGKEEDVKTDDGNDEVTDKDQTETSGDDKEKEKPTDTPVDL